MICKCICTYIFEFTVYPKSLSTHLSYTYTYSYEFWRNSTSFTKTCASRMAHRLRQTSDINNLLPFKIPICTPMVKVDKS